MLNALPNSKKKLHALIASLREELEARDEQLRFRQLLINERDAQLKEHSALIEKLKFEPEFLPSKIQLAQDLLRLGRDEEGWQLAEEVSAYMTGRRVQAYEYSSWELFRRFAARNKAAAPTC